jgi:UDP-glucuronate 4-epimerase
MKILVTGAAGFIGSKLMYTLKKRGDEVVGIDNFNDYYDPRLKEARCREFGLDVKKIDIADKEAVDKLFEEEKFDVSGSHTISVGVTTTLAGEHVDVFCMRVDDALYEAKKTGKNRIVIK